MLHLAGCAPYLTRDAPFHAIVAHRRSDLAQGGVICWGHRHVVERAEFTLPRGVDPPDSAAFTNPIDGRQPRVIHMSEKSPFRQVAPPRSTDQRRAFFGQVPVECGRRMPADKSFPVGTTLTPSRSDFPAPGFDSMSAQILRGISEIHSANCGL